MDNAECVDVSTATSTGVASARSLATFFFSALFPLFNSFGVFRFFVIADSSRASALIETDI